MGDGLTTFLKFYVFLINECNNLQMYGCIKYRYKMHIFYYYSCKITKKKKTKGKRKNENEFKELFLLNAFIWKNPNR